MRTGDRTADLMEPHLIDDLANKERFYWCAGERDSQGAAPGRKVLILVPARPELWSYWDQMHGYHRRYTKKMLAGVFDASWALEHLEYSFSWMYPVVWSFRMTMRRRRSAEGHSDIIEVKHRPHFIVRKRY